MKLKYFCLVYVMSTNKTKMAATVEQHLQLLTDPGTSTRGKVNIMKESTGRENSLYFREHNVIPYENCCVLSGSVKRCEEFYARRPSSNCRGYIPPWRSTYFCSFSILPSPFEIPLVQSTEKSDTIEILLLL